MADPAPSRLEIHAGARATEAAVLAAVDRLAAEARSDPRLLARPVRVVVPSTGLRLHLASRQAAGGARAGVLVQSHFSVALEILERVGRTPPRGRLLFDLLPHRLARREPDLARPLEALDGGFGAVTETVRDLLDAGLEAPLAEGVHELLETLPRKTATAVQRARGAALVRVAAAVAEALRELGIGHPSRLFDRAARELAADPETALPARAVLVHGFADATGRVTDLLEALARSRSPERRVRVYLDRPPDPAGTGGPHGAHPALAPGPSVAAGDRAGGAADRFGRSFVDRLSFALPNSGATSAPPTEATTPPRLTGVTARGSREEVFEAALTLRGWLDEPDAPAPESIAVVVRDPAPYRRLLRHWLERLGVPHGSLGETGSVTPAGRRAAAALELLRDGADTLTDRFLDAAGEPPGDGPETSDDITDLRLACYALGLGRLRDLAELEPAAVLRRDRYELPTRQGFEESDGDGPTRTRRRAVSGRALRAWVGRARDALHRFEDWPLEATLEDHRRLAEELLRGLSAADAAGDTDPGPLEAAWRRIREEAPPGFAVERGEWLDLVTRAVELRDALAAPMRGGAPGYGGGVRILTVTEARALTFDRLYVLGLHRGGFPRVVRQDALLPDSVRFKLREVLPDLPLKEVGHDEERYLFSQLLSAAPEITLSWQVADDAGGPRTISPLVERLRRSGRAFPVRPARAPADPPPTSPPSDGTGDTAESPLPVDLHLLRHALHAPPAVARGRVHALIPAALEDARRRLGLPPRSPELLTAVAGARRATLDELDPDLHTPDGRARSVHLGPFFGFVGDAAAGLGDPRRDRLSITLLERLAGCPWQVFLERVLGLAPTPDPLELPAFSPLVKGNVIHGVLDEIVRRSLGEQLVPSLDAATADTPGTTVPWPSPERLDVLVTEVTKRVLAEEGIFLPGLGRALALLVRPALEAAREVDWGSGDGPRVLGSEVKAELTARDLDDEPATIAFRIDRVDRVDRTGPPDGGLELTDYKTGGDLLSAKSEAKREEALLRAVGAGRLLQAVGYTALADSPDRPGDTARGRYLQLKDGLDRREIVVDGADESLRRALEDTLRVLLSVWRRGTLLPRVVDPEGRSEPDRCGYCPVAEACLRHDSGARLRLVRWAEREPDRTSPDLARLAVARRLWFLPDPSAGETAP